MKILNPPNDAKGLMKSAIRDDNPVIFSDHKKLGGLIGEIPEDDYIVPIGKANIVRFGKDVTFVTYGFMVHKSMETAEQLIHKNIDAEIIDLRTTLPIDSEAILESIAKTGRLVTVAESYAPCSVASEVAAIVMEKGFDLLKAPLRRIYAKFAPIPFAITLENYVLPQTENIILAIESILI
ncbi:MAG: alpha-ketoacid dehydrogenase subunit beta [bacterium]